MKIKPIAQAFVWGGGLVCALLLALIGHYLFAQRYLLRLESPRDPLADISRGIVRVVQPVVLVTGGHGSDEALRKRFRDAVGLGGHVPLDAADMLVRIQDITRANPYPQPLNVVRGAGVDYLSYGYIGEDARYHQVTYYWGEADTTPSPLVRKVRGAETGWGDYFVRYTVYVSRDVKRSPHTWETQSPYFHVDRVDWSTYEGGSYNGFEEMTFALYATGIEALVAASLWAASRALKLSKQAAATDRLAGG